MKQILALSCLAMGAVLLSAGSLAATETGQAPASPAAAAPSSPAAQDSTLAAKIKAEMAAQHLASLSSISVDSDAGGVVTLSGYALSQDDIDKTLSIVRGTAGVTSVNNSLAVKASK